MFLLLQNQIMVNKIYLAKSKSYAVKTHHNYFKVLTLKDEQSELKGRYQAGMY